MTQERSPHLANAVRAAMYFNWARKAGDRGGGGRWLSVVRTADQVYTTEFSTEAQARAHVGLTGGSKDPAYRPPAGETNAEVAIPNDDG